MLVRFLAVLGAFSLVAIGSTALQATPAVSHQISPKSESSAFGNEDDERVESDDEDDDDDADKSDDDSAKQTRKKKARNTKKGEDASEDDDADADKSDDDSDDEDENDEDEESKEPEDISLDGHFVAAKMTPISRRLEEWSEMKIEKIVEHGAEVRAGDVVVSLDITDIDKAISDLEHDISLEKLALEQASDQLDLLRKTTDMDLTSALRKSKIEKEDLELFFHRDKEAMREQNDFSLKSQENRLSYQEEELEQLLKMYEEDDLTEETEEIILQRTRNQVEQGKFYLKMYKMTHDDFSKFRLPRQQETMERSAERAEIALDRAKATLPASVRKQELDLQKQQVTHKRTLEKLATLKRDRKSMTIMAPRSGIVYYGECENGVFPSSRDQAQELRPNETLNSDEVFMTILELRPIYILADVEESDLRHVKEGESVKVVATAFPDEELNAKVSEISKFPVDDGTFSVEFACRLGNKAARIVPGMKCEVKITPEPSPESEADEDSDSEEKKSKSKEKKAAKKKE